MGIKITMKTRNRRTMLLGYIGITCVSLIMILYSIYGMNIVCNESNFIIEKILPQKILSTEILTSLINQETGVRAYIISENKAFLEPYYLESEPIQGYYDSLDNLKDVNFKNQMKSIQSFYKAQIALVDEGKLSEAKSNLDEGKKLVDKFRVTVNIQIDRINLEIISFSNKVANTRKFQQYLLTFLGILLACINIIFLRYIWSYIYEEVSRKDKENKRLERLLVLEEEFTANISHELKTPLNVIFSAVQLFSVYCNSDSLDEKKDSVNKYIKSIKQNCFRLSKLINNIVDSSKIKAGFFELNLSNNNIVEVVEEIVMSVVDFTGSKSLNIIFDTDMEEKIIACDPEKIERIILNLISNAMKFSNKHDEVFVDIKDKNDFIEISIKDNGIGIKDNNLDMIFDRFKQVDKSLSRNSEGTGIGLSLVKSIVELHGGSISVESEYGKGSKFTVILPTQKVMQENILHSTKLRNKNDGVQVELSDIYFNEYEDDNKTI